MITINFEVPLLPGDSVLVCPAPSLGKVMLHGYLDNMQTWRVDLCPCPAHLEAARKLVTALEAMMVERYAPDEIDAAEALS